MSRKGDATSTDGGPDTPEAIRRAPGYLARRLHQAYTAAWARKVDATLTGPQYAVLSTVEVHPKVDQGSLAHTVALDRSTMADVCRRLEERGLIERTTAPSDGRRKLLELTAQGRDSLGEIRRRVHALDVELLARRDDHDELLTELVRLSETWEAVAADPHGAD